jgi:hypothetical protein
MPALQWGPPQPPPYGYSPPPGWARPRIDRSLQRPKAWWYATAAIPLVLGVAGTALCIVLAVRAFPDEPRAFATLDPVRLDLKAGEDQTIYRQARGGAPTLTATPSCTVRNELTERTVTVRRSGNTTLTFNGRRYESELDFDVPKDGVYRVACRPVVGPNPQPLAVGERPHLARFGALVVGAIASFGLGVLLTAGAIALVAVLRHSHKRRLEREAIGPPT